MWPTWLVSIPVGVWHFIPTEPVERAGAALVMEADPEGITRAAEHQAVGEGLLEPFKIQKDFFKRQHQKNTLWCLLFAVGSECVSVYVLYAPIGNGNKGRSIVLTGLPGLIKGKQIFSHPVTSWTVPLPALRVEQRI